MPFGYLLQGYQGPLLGFLESSEPKKMEYETSGQEMPKRWMYRHSQEVPLNMSLGSPCFIYYTFFRQKAKLMVLGLLVQTAGLSGFSDYRTSD